MTQQVSAQSTAPVSQPPRKPRPTPVRFTDWASI